MFNLRKASRKYLNLYVDKNLLTFIFTLWTTAQFMTINETTLALMTTHLPHSLKKFLYLYLEALDKLKKIHSFVLFIQKT
jgi:Fe-S cluster biosynthesis and repair protein YggX